MQPIICEEMQVLDVSYRGPDLVGARSNCCSLQNLQLCYVFFNSRQQIMPMWGPIVLRSALILSYVGESTTQVLAVAHHHTYVGKVQCWCQQQSIICGVKQVYFDRILHLGFCEVHVAQSLVFCVMFCRSLFFFIFFLLIGYCLTSDCGLISRVDILFLLVSVWHPVVV